MKLGVIEGFFGTTWPCTTRENIILTLNQLSFDQFLYAPKADTSLRSAWNTTSTNISTTLSHRLTGIGLSPFELHLDPSASKMNELENKVCSLNKFEPSELAILFDDMRGEIPHLAQIQADIAHRAMEVSNAETLLVCPSYYSDDPILDKVFGQRPENYLEDLGRLLDPCIEIFWTGPKVCSNQYTDEAIVDISEKLNRKPTLWDNYPVNDGERMCKFLHLSGFENRRNLNENKISGHYVNPMNQAWLSLIPLATLAMNYKDKEYCPDDAADIAIDNIFTQILARELKIDRHDFQNLGLDGIEPTEKQSLINKYSDIANQLTSKENEAPSHTPDIGACREIIGWLNNEYAFDPACLTD